MKNPVSFELQNDQMFSPGQWDVFRRLEKWEILCPELNLGLPQVESSEHEQWQKGHIESHDSGKEILFAFSGECLYGVRGRIYRVEPGTLLMINNGQLHDGTYSPFCKDFSHMWIHVSSSYSYGAFCRMEHGRLKKDPVGVPLPQWALKEINAIWDGQEFLLPDTMIACRLKILLAEVIMQIMNHRLAITGRGALFAKHVIMTAVGMLNKYFNRGINLEDVAKSAGYSKYHFARLFREHMGVTVGDYINKLRIRKTLECHKLGMRKKEIADILGFSSPVTFSRWFKQNIRNE